MHNKGRPSDVNLCKPDNASHVCSEVGLQAIPDPSRLTIDHNPHTMLRSFLSFDRRSSHNKYSQVNFLMCMPLCGDCDKWNRMTEAMQPEIKGKDNAMFREPIFPKLQCPNGGIQILQFITSY